MKELDEPTIASILSSSFPPCSSHEIAVRPGDCVEGRVEKWLEDEAFSGFRVWQLAGIILSILLSVLIGLCCCIRFRVPRTKQEIEADYIRKKITESFRQELSKISNTEMDDMNLKKVSLNTHICSLLALSKIQNKFDMEVQEIQKDHQEATYKNIQHGLRSRFNAMFSGIHFTKQEHPNVDSII
ncbi:uncharacterized protein LOC132909267 isoform X1 [Bombus pascuorum]|uniref:uncharacterized protein LOC132909267 isoform X1 n=1 Tax=Bombus pascuorum TaxID=65598 RepID=UPI00298E1648|nr:uncharacterized protein LOC132909267 isoform X1 [Bombus pascuorum]XP_060819984.1 uncharacterized protein LOC132909267 isoform X1 [Bombus pascuorum]